MIFGAVKINIGGMNRAQIRKHWFHHPAGDTKDEVAQMMRKSSTQVKKLTELVKKSGAVS